MVKRMNKMLKKVTMLFFVGTKVRLFLYYTNETKILLCITKFLWCRQYLCKIPEKIFGNDKYTYEKYKGNQYPNDTLIIFCVQLFILFIGKYDHDREKDDENYCENQLTLAEHVPTFRQT